MPKDGVETFTDRHEAIALFDHLRGRDPEKPWPLLPILTFIAPGGSGKSILIEYLRATAECRSIEPGTYVAVRPTSLSICGNDYSRINSERVILVL